MNLLHPANRWNHPLPPNARCLAVATYLISCTLWLNAALAAASAPGMPPPETSPPSIQQGSADPSALQHAHLHHIIKQHPRSGAPIAAESSTAWLSLGTYLMSHDLSPVDLAQVEAWLVRQLSHQPNDPWLHYHLTLNYLKLSFTQPGSSQLWHNHKDHYFQKAMQLAYQITLLNPNHLLATLATAQIGFYLGDLQGALSQLKALHRTHHPMMGEALLLHSHILELLRVNQAEEILWLVEQPGWHQLDPTIYAHITHKLIPYLSLDQTLRWLDQHEPTQASSQDWSAVMAYLKGKAYFVHGYNHEAQALFARALAAGWKNLDLTLSYSAMMFTTEPQIVRRLAQIAFPLEDHQLVSTWSQPWFLGLSYLFTHQYKQASAIFKDHLQGSHMHAPHMTYDTLTIIAQMYTTQHAAGELTELLEQLRIELPQLTQIHALLADVYKQAQRPELARSYWQNALTFEPTNHHYHHELAHNYLAHGDLHQALSSFQLALRYHPQPRPDSAPDLLQIASLQAILGQSEQALSNLHKALLWKPELRSRARTNKSFDSLKTHPTFKQLLHSPLEAS